MKLKLQTACLLFLIALGLFFVLSCSKKSNGIMGTWKMIVDKSSDIDPWRNFKLEISGNDSVLTITKARSAGRDAEQRSMKLLLGGVKNQIVVHGPKWADNLHIAVFLKPNSTKTVTAKWLNIDKTLEVKSQITLETSQGEAPVSIESVYKVARSGNELVLRQRRSSRSKAMVYYFKRM
ncbi:MAG: hypothetical protein GWP06_14490 [Actinobacteria bacterium]|nr:hypothetical protein [Actinomycetota bacterium]